MIRHLVLAGVALTMIFAALVSFYKLASAQVVDGPDCVEFVTETEPYDGNIIAAGSTVLKTWTIRNCGETVWEGYRAVRTEGRLYPGARVIDISTTKPGETAEVVLEFPVPEREGLRDYYIKYEVAAPYSDSRRMTRIGEQFWMLIWATDEEVE